MHKKFLNCLTSVIVTLILIASPFNTMAVTFSEDFESSLPWPPENIEQITNPNIGEFCYGCCNCGGSSAGTWEYGTEQAHSGIHSFKSNFPICEVDRPITCLADNRGSFTDLTVAAGDNGAVGNDVVLLPANPKVGDALYFGDDSQIVATSQPTPPYYGGNYITINIKTPGVGDWTLAWEYFNIAAGQWTALENLDDTTLGFTADPGEHHVTFKNPVNWGKTAVNGLSKYWIRAMVSNFTSMTVQPKADYIDWNCDYCPIPSIHYYGAAQGHTVFSEATIEGWFYLSPTLDLSEGAFKFLDTRYEGTVTGQGILLAMHQTNDVNKDISIYITSNHYYPEGSPHTIPYLRLYLCNADGSTYRITRGEWHHVKWYLKPGGINSYTGEMKLWIDGNLMKVKYGHQTSDPTSGAVISADISDYNFNAIQLTIINWILNNSYGMAEGPGQYIFWDDISVTSGDGGEVPACTESDWFFQNSICQIGGTLTRTWTRTGNCFGGVTHSVSEQIACSYKYTLSDFGNLYNKWHTNDSTYDLNDDGIVNSRDFGLMMRNWNLAGNIFSGIVNYIVWISIIIAVLLISLIYFLKLKYKNYLNEDKNQDEI